ncbi:4647_t:CDS:2, partial [Dentiscutata heterogama]
YPLINFDKMTHMERIYFLRWVNNSKYEKSLFQNMLMDLWNNKISDKNLDRIFQTSLLYHINKFKSSNGTKESNTEVKPNQKEPRQEIVFPSIKR